MVKTRALPKEEWAELLERISREVAQRGVRVEVEGLDIGAQTEAEHAPLGGISYDPKGDTVQIIVEGAEHMIVRPRSIHAAIEGAGLAALEITDGDGVHHILRPETPLALPPAAR